MSFLSYNLKGLAATLSVSPAPSTLADSTAVLRKLQKFGRVRYFKKLDVSKSQSVQYRDSALSGTNHLQRYKVIFSDPETLQNAVSESPFTLSVNENLPNPEDLDPYNIRGLQLRKQPQFQKYSCHIESDGSEDQMEEVGRHVFYGRFKSKLQFADRIKRSKELAEAKAPLSILEGLGTSVEDAEAVADDSALPSTGTDDHQDETSEFSSDDNPTSANSSKHDWTSPPDLMAMYRGSLDSRQSVNWPSILGKPLVMTASGEHKRLRKKDYYPLRRARLQKKYGERETVELESDNDSRYKEYDPYGLKG